MFVYMYIHIFIYMYINMHTCTYEYLCMYVHTYVCVYICISLSVSLACSLSLSLSLSLSISLALSPTHSFSLSFSVSLSHVYLCMNREPERLPNSSSTSPSRFSEKSCRIANGERSSSGNVSNFCATADRNAWAPIVCLRILRGSSLSSLAARSRTGDDIVRASAPCRSWFLIFSVYIHMHACVFVCVDVCAGVCVCVQRQIHTL